MMGNIPGADHKPECDVLVNRIGGMKKRDILEHRVTLFRLCPMFSMELDQAALC